MKRDLITPEQVLSFFVDEVGPKGWFVQSDRRNVWHIHSEDFWAKDDPSRWPQHNHRAALLDRYRDHS